MSNALSTYTTPDDPSDIGFPHMLPIELALRTGTPKEICAAHGVSKQEWDELRVNPVFVKALTEAIDLVKKEGMSFKLRAGMQAEEYLKTLWAIAHSTSEDVPASVKADIAKFTIRAAGLDQSIAQKAMGGAGQHNALQIILNLG